MRVSARRRRPSSSNSRNAGAIDPGVGHRRGDDHRARLERLFDALSSGFVPRP
ncbi:hypothetical protein [Nonomuraea sp. CA-141351]|uniref:hypothetical protein n=1 Tax=Nonomuraea sp. CA-141351 TaxID=3239996 RepID=UPI003D904737